jgi:hypothetical protein
MKVIPIDLGFKINNTIPEIIPETVYLSMFLKGIFMFNSSLNNLYFKIKEFMLFDNHAKDHRNAIK